MNQKDVMKIYRKCVKKSTDKDGSLYNEKYEKAAADYEKELNKLGGKIIYCGCLHDLDILETFKPIFSSIGYNLMNNPLNFGDDNTLILAPKNKNE